MYRIVCESYKNYMKDFDDKTRDFRYKVMLPFSLIVDLNKYKYEKQIESIRYKKLEDFVWKIKRNENKYPRLKSFIWSLESRGIKGRNYKVLDEIEFEEQVKIIEMFLKLSYWN
ncbi:MAG: hypothetical protein FH753_03265 [Firmicutes bacterium]|nr:hypothetical protein [Bacillota bacterium]